jgi:hypothetical protein
MAGFCFYPSSFACTFARSRRWWGKIWSPVLYLHARPRVGRFSISITSGSAADASSLELSERPAKIYVRRLSVVFLNICLVFFSLYPFLIFLCIL